MITVNCVPLTVCIVAWPDWPIESTSTRNSATPTPTPPPSPRATGHWQAHSDSDANARGEERDHESYNIYRTAHIAMSHRRTVVYTAGKHAHARDTGRCAGGRDRWSSARAPWPQMHNWIYVCSSSFLSALHGLGRPGPMDDKRGQQSQTPQLRALSCPSMMGRWDPSRGACARNCTESPDHRLIPNTVGPLHEHARRTRIALVETRRTHLR